MLKSLKLELWHPIYEQVSMDVEESFWDSIHYNTRDQISGLIGSPFTWALKFSIRIRIERQLEDELKEKTMEY